jgi:hypothetical protein
LKLDPHPQGKSVQAIAGGTYIQFVAAKVIISNCGFQVFAEINMRGDNKMIQGFIKKIGRG